MRDALRSAAGLAAALFILVPAAGASARDSDVLVVEAQRRSDAEIARDVRKAILGYANTTVFDNYAFMVDNGKVTLLGSVLRPYRSKDVAARVARVAGVTSVDNRIEVQPASGFDDQVRFALARAIYGNFVHYGLGTNPSVRILVARGRVTLAGVVSSRVDQVQIGLIARHIAPFGVNNQLVVESEMLKEPVKAPVERI